MYSVVITDAIPWDENDDRSCLIIKDGGGLREYYDGGEPEDNKFYRSYSWIKNELNQAYRQGMADGRNGKI